MWVSEWVGMELYLCSEALEVSPGVEGPRQIMSD